MAAPVSMVPPMGDTPVTPAMGDEPVDTGTPTLFWLYLQGNQVYTAAPDGSGAKSFASAGLLHAPDGVTVDPVGKHVFVLNMGGVGAGGGNNGSLVRYNLDGSGGEEIMKPGSMADGQTFNTGKQVALDRVNSKLYLGDREGSKVWRCDLDGKNLEVLVSGHGIMQIVGVAPDPTKDQFYFSDRNGKKLFRASMKMPEGKTHADRDLELLYADPASNAMPLDLELDLKTRTLYWTDRQQNKVFGMPMDLPAGQDPMTRSDVKAIASNLPDVIGLGFDHQEGMLYVTHSGSLSRFKTDGSGLERLATGGAMGTTGVSFVRLP